MAAAKPVSRTYLDYNAATPLRPVARDAVLLAMESPGNPSSVHAEGRAARRIVEDARSEIAVLAGAAPRAVTFVSGGTEAANAALNMRFGAEQKEAPLDRLIVGAGEHPCVMLGHRFPASAVEIAPLGADGRIDLDWLEAACRRSGRILLALQGANNETGVIQPVAAAGALVHAAGGRVFCDAVQLAGRVDFDIDSLGADALALSAHKIGGPKGAGALAAKSVGFNLGEPLIRGGGQERGARAGTENVAAIAGFGAAARACLTEAAREAERLAGLRDRLADTIRDIGAGRRNVWPSVAAIAEYPVLRRARRRGGDADDRARPRRCGPELGIRLFIGQGDAVACAGRHGRSAGAGALRTSVKPRMVVDGV